MVVTATVTSRGRITIPKTIRDALRIREGDSVAIRVEGDRALITRTPHFLDLAGTVRVPPAKRTTSWGEVVRRTRSARAQDRGPAGYLRG